MLPTSAVQNRREDLCGFRVAKDIRDGWIPGRLESHWLQDRLGDHGRVTQRASKA